MASVILNKGNGVWLHAWDVVSVVLENASAIKILKDILT